MPLDPSIGSLNLYSSKLIYSAETGATTKSDQVLTEETDFTLKNETVLWYNNSSMRGVYSVKDPKNLSLKGTFESIDKKYINLTFVECEPNLMRACKSEQEIEAFLQTK